MQDYRIINAGRAQFIYKYTKVQKKLCDGFQFYTEYKVFIIV
jgi:hypothetical protein